MSPRRPPTKFIDDYLLGQVLQQIAYRQCAAQAAPYLIEAAHRLQGRAPPRPPNLFQRLAGAIGLSG